MSHALKLTEDQYKIIKAAADASGNTPEDLFLTWTMEEETRYRLAHPPTVRRMIGSATWV